jgi:hypothetical protein
MLEKIRVEFFVLSFCVGIFIVYVMSPKRELVYKFPSPDNQGLVYRDSSDSCYIYKTEEVECNSKTVHQPITE